MKTEYRRKDLVNVIMPSGKKIKAIVLGESEVPGKYAVMTYDGEKERFHTWIGGTVKPLDVGSFYPKELEPRTN